MSERKPYRVTRALIQDAHTKGYYSVGDILMLEDDVAYNLIRCEMIEKKPIALGPQTASVAAPEKAVRKRGRPRKKKANDF